MLGTLSAIAHSICTSIPLNSIESAFGHAKFANVYGNRMLQVNNNHNHERKFGVCGKFRSKCIHRTHGHYENEEEDDDDDTKKPTKMYDMNTSNVYLTRTYY